MGIFSSLKKGWDEGVREVQEKRNYSCGNCKSGTGQCKYCKDKSEFSSTSYESVSFGGEMG